MIHYLRSIYRMVDRRDGAAFIGLALIVTSIVLDWKLALLLVGCGILYWAVAGVKRGNTQ